MHNTYHTNQCGGGSWAMYCDLCHLPFYNRFGGKEVIDKKHELYKLRNVDLTWLERGLGYDKHTQSIIPVRGDDGYGVFPVRGKMGKEFVADAYNKDAEKEFDAFGVVFHEDCIRYINSSFTPLTYEKHEELREIIKRQYRTKYESQFYEWKMALEREGANYFHSPMISQGGKTRERINKLLAFMTTRVSPPTVLCLSHKTREECVRVHNKCVWGKTGKCSKKRSTIKHNKRQGKCSLLKNSGDCGMDAACNWNAKTNKCSRNRNITMKLNKRKPLLLQDGGVDCKLDETINTNPINTFTTLEHILAKCDFIPITIQYKEIHILNENIENNVLLYKDIIEIAKKMPNIYTISITRIEKYGGTLLLDSDLSANEIIEMFRGIYNSNIESYNDEYSQLKDEYELHSKLHKEKEDAYHKKYEEVLNHNAKTFSFNKSLPKEIPAFTEKSPIEPSKLKDVIKIVIKSKIENKCFMSSVLKTKI
jgi:hypothetical protein